MLLTTPALHAQTRSEDDELKALVPDSAVANPEQWAKARPQDAPPPPILAPDPTSPLADIPGITLPWPDENFAVPQLAPLDPDPDVAAVLAAAPGQDEMRMPEGEVEKLSHNVALVFPATTQSLPERVEIASRFKALSTLERLGGSSDDNVAQVGARARTDKALLEKLMRVYGYYDAQIVQTVGGIEPGQTVAPKEVAVRFDIIPGKRYDFAAIDLGELPQTGADYPPLRKQFGIETGDPLYSDKIVDGTIALAVGLGETGYAFGKVGEPDLLVDHQREAGDLTLPVTPGGKYNFGLVNSNDEKFLSGKHLLEIARFDPGDLYKKSQVDDLRRAVLATGLVSSVTVTPRETAPPADGQPGTVALDVGLSRAPLRTIAGAIGYDTGDGFRVEASWEHRNLFPPEGLLRVRGIAGTKEQLAGVTFRRNNFKGRDQVLTIDAYSDNANNNAFKARTVALSATFEKLTTLIFQKPFTYSVGATFLLTDERSATVAGAAPARTTYEIAALPVSARWDSTDSLLDPTRGWRLGLSVSPEYSRTNAGSSTYARVQLDGSYYLPVGKTTILAARVRAGSIPGSRLATIAPSRRFYAGGGGSVRGFGYREIGPRDALGNPIGGRSLSEASFEARIGTGFLGGALQVVPFVDAGAVDDTVTPRFRDLRLGAGIGVRYKTGFGPLRVDVATPLNRRTGESRIGVYVALGQAF